MWWYGPKERNLLGADVDKGLDGAPHVTLQCMLVVALAYLDPCLFWMHIDQGLLDWNP